MYMHGDIKHRSEVMTREPTRKRIKYLIEDEKKASKEYSKYGFKKLAKDESRHRTFLQKKLSQVKGD